MRHILVDRDAFTLTLYRRPPLRTKFELVKRYPIAVGRVGYETPRGLFQINSRSKCPTWTMPNSDWIEPALRGVTLKCGDPNNPIRYRWLGVTDDGVGIHGIPPEEEDSIGEASSHGCLRMHKDDVIELYPQVPKFTTVTIV